MESDPSRTPNNPQAVDPLAPPASSIDEQPGDQLATPTTHPSPTEQPSLEHHAQPEHLKDVEAQEQKSRLARNLGVVAVGAARTGHAVKQTLAVSSSYVRKHSKQTAVRAGETLGAANDYSAIAVNSLRKVSANRKLKKINIERIEVSAKVHKEVAQAVIDGRVIDSELKPATVSQRRQAARASNRQGKANLLHYEDQYRLERVFGKEITESGYIDKIKAQRKTGRLGLLEARRAIKGGEQYQKNEKKRAKLSGHPEDEGKVHKSAQGRDIPGKVISHRHAKKTEQISKLGERIGRLDGSMNLKHRGIEERRKRRELRKRKH